MRNIFCFDLDGTLTKRELLPLIATEVGLEHEFEVLTKLTIDGVISFDESLRLRFAILKTISIKKVQNIILDVELFSSLVEFISKRPTECYVVTGNLDVWVSPLLDKLGCHYFTSSTYYSDDNLISLNYIMKKNEMVTLIREREPNAKIFAIGDGLNDYSMFEASDIAISVGLTHKPSSILVSISDYIVYEEKALCNLLNTL